MTETLRSLVETELGQPVDPRVREVASAIAAQIWRRGAGNIVLRLVPADRRSRRTDARFLPDRFRLSARLRQELAGVAEPADPAQCLSVRACRPGRQICGPVGGRFPARSIAARRFRCRSGLASPNRPGWPGRRTRRPRRLASRRSPRPRRPCWRLARPLLAQDDLPIRSTSGAGLCPYLLGRAARRAGGAGRLHVDSDPDRYRRFTGPRSKRPASDISMAFSGWRRSAPTSAGEPASGRSGAERQAAERGAAGKGERHLRRRHRLHRLEDQSPCGNGHQDQAVAAALAAARGAYSAASLVEAGGDPLRLTRASAAATAAARAATVNGLRSMA